MCLADIQGRILHSDVRNPKIWLSLLSRGWATIRSASVFLPPNSIIILVEKEDSSKIRGTFSYDLNLNLD